MDKKVFFFSLYSLIIIFLNPFALLAASFDCLKANTKTEKAICSDPILSQLDDDLAVAYNKELKTADRLEIKEEQREWLKEILGPCKDDKECIKKAYESRLNQFIAGCYYELVTPRSISDGKMHTAYRTLELTFLHDDQFQFSITVIGANFHECSGEGKAVVKRKGKETIFEMVRDVEQIEEETKRKLKPCQLIIRFTNGHIIIDDEEGACHKYFICSDRVSYGDANFNTNSKKPICPQ